MTDLIRRIVSGKKARFKDADLKVDLDLVYITENLIIMGYPAHGVASLYRNPRNEVRRFLESRHSKDWRIYNL